MVQGLTFILYLLKNNRYIASRPLVLVFDLAGVALHQFFLLLRTLLLLIWNPLSSIWNRRLRRSQGQQAGSTFSLTSVNVGGGQAGTQSSVVVDLLWEDNKKGITSHTTNNCSSASSALFGWWCRFLCNK